MVIWNGEWGYGMGNGDMEWGMGTGMGNGDMEWGMGIESGEW